MFHAHHPNSQKVKRKINIATSVQIGQKKLYYTHFYSDTFRYISNSTANLLTCYHANF